MINSRHRCIPLLLAFVMLVLSCACSHNSDIAQTGSSTTITKGAAATTTSFASQPFTLRFVGKDGEPLAGADIAYSPVQGTDEVRLAGTTDAQGYVQTNWEYSSSVWMSFGIDHEQGYTVSCTVTPEDVKKGLTISPDGPVR